MTTIADAAVAPPARDTDRPALGRTRRWQRTPVVAQMEEQDCGAACLTMVLAAYGRRVPLHEVRAACGVSRDGASAAAIVKAASAFGLLGRGRLVALAGPDGGPDPSRLPVPSILLVDGPHFVVFEGVRRGRAWLNDPALGRHRVTPAELTRAFRGIAIGFETTPVFRPGGVRFPMARTLLGKVRPYLGALTFAVLTALVVAVPTVAASLLVRALLTAASGRDAGLSMGWLSLALAVAVVLVAFGTWLQQTGLGRALVDMAVRSSSTFLWRLLRLPGTFFHRRQLGGLVTRVQLNDGLALLLTSRATTAATSLLMAAIYLATLVWISPVLSLVAVGVAAGDVVALRGIARQRADEQHRLQSEEYHRDGVAFAGLTAIESIKAEGAEDALFASWAGWQARVLTTTQRLASRAQTLLAVPSTLNTLAAGLVVVIGGVRVLDGTMALGDLVAFQLLLSGFLLPITTLVGLGVDLQIAKAEAAMVDDVLDAEPDPYRTPVVTMTDRVRPRLAGRVEVDRVTFGYDPNRPPVLDEISLTLRPGERVAVVGPSGSGKSTLARLVAGVLEPWAGTIRFDGVARADVPRAVLTCGVAYVEQQLHLFEGTAKENISLWDPTLPEAQLTRALADARLEHVIAGRGGLDAAWIADDAHNLSGGERQRLELARALALDPAVVILDEATSALDAETEHLVTEHLRLRACTALVLAHRLSTVRDADHILVLDRGRIVEQGRHADLLAAGGLYARLVGDEP